jgi:hypothetical protein
MQTKRVCFCTSRASCSTVADVEQLHQSSEFMLDVLKNYYFGTKAPPAIELKPSAAICKQAIHSQELLNKGMLCHAPQ